MKKKLGRAKRARSGTAVWKFVPRSGGKNRHKRYKWVRR